MQEVHQPPRYPESDPLLHVNRAIAKAWFVISVDGSIDMYERSVVVPVPLPLRWLQWLACSYTSAG
jgi:hypothetical protein